MSLPVSRWLGCALVALAVVPALLAFDRSPNQDRVWARFKHPVMFSDRLLPEGRYLFVHDDDKSAMMEPCLYVYSESDLDEPLLGVHCLRRMQAPVNRDRIVWGNVRGDNLREFGYIQFAGDAFAHYVR